VAEFCSTRRPGGDPVRHSIIDGFLVTADVVVGPLTMIPAEDHRDEVVKLMSKIICHPQHKPVDYKVPLEKQMRQSVSKLLHAIHSKPAFIDGAEELFLEPCESLSSSDTELVGGEDTKTAVYGAMPPSLSSESDSGSASEDSASTSAASVISPGFGFLKTAAGNLARPKGNKRKRKIRQGDKPPRAQAEAMIRTSAASQSKRPRRDSPGKVAIT
jgi:hypothetical protein